MSPADRLVYLDASALVKLVAEEPESSALRSFLALRAHRVSSALTRVELARTILRSTLGTAGRRRADDVLEGVALIRLSDDILAAAGGMEPPRLRTLDALHLATALSVRSELAELVTYDRRLAEAAAAAGLDVAAPV